MFHSMFINLAKIYLSKPATTYNISNIPKTLNNSKNTKHFFLDFPNPKWSIHTLESTQ